LIFWGLKGTEKSRKGEMDGDVDVDVLFLTHNPSLFTLF
jgi:hypothetical protein